MTNLRTSAWEASQATPKGADHKTFLSWGGGGGGWFEKKNPAFFLVYFIDLFL